MSPKEQALQGFERIWGTIDPRKKTQELKDDFNNAYCFIRDAELIEAPEPQDPPPAPEATDPVDPQPPSGEATDPGDQSDAPPPADDFPEDGPPAGDVPGASAAR